MPERQIFYKDECLGEFSGDIRAALVPLFPKFAADKILISPPVESHWRAYERVTWEGYRGFRFHTDDATCKLLKSLCETIYSDCHKRAGYPDHFTENTEAEGLPRVCIDTRYFVVWQPGRVDVPPRP